MRPKVLINNVSQEPMVAAWATMAAAPSAMLIQPLNATPIYLMATEYTISSRGNTNRYSNKQ